MTLADAVFEADSMLSVELAGGGDVAGADFDPLVIDNTGTINGGTLSLSYVGEFTASAGDQFVVLDETTLTGMFSAVSFPDANAGWSVSYDLIAGTVTVMLPGMTLIGDANNDGQVTGLDLIAVQQSFGNAAPPNDGTLPGDANSGGLVTGLDLISIQQNFGTASSQRAPGVPEPTAIVPLLAGLGWWGRCR